MVLFPSVQTPSTMYTLQRPVGPSTDNCWSGPLNICLSIWQTARSYQSDLYKKPTVSIVPLTPVCTPTSIHLTRILRSTSCIPSGTRLEKSRYAHMDVYTDKGTQYESSRSWPRLLFYEFVTIIHFSLLRFLCSGLSCLPLHSGRFYRLSLRGLTDSHGVSRDLGSTTSVRPHVWCHSDLPGNLISWGSETLHPYSNPLTSPNDVFLLIFDRNWDMGVLDSLRISPPVRPSPKYRTYPTLITR